MRTSVATLVVSVVLVTGCTQLPTADLTQYREAFAQVQASAEVVLVDYDLALKDSRAFKAVAAAPSPAPVAPYPAELDGANGAGAIADDIEVRRLALRVVATYNDTLVQLAEGKSIESVKTSAKSLVSSSGAFAAMLGGTSIPGLSQLAGLVATLAEQLERARLRQEFVQALQKGAPVVERILDQLMEDTRSHYKLRVTLETRDRLRTVAALRSANESVGAIVGAHRVSIKEAEALQRRANTLLDAAKADLAPILPVSFSAGSAVTPPFSEIAQGQVESAMRVLEDSSASYADNVRRMKAVESMLNEHRRLLSRTRQSLGTLKGSLDAPPDLAAASEDLVALVFRVKRNYEDYKAVRR